MSRLCSILVSMDTKFSAIRAIGSMMFEEMVRLVTIITSCILGALLILAWWLTANVSQWWGLFLALVVLLVILAMVLRFVAMWLLKRMYGAPLTREQHVHTKAFVGKVQSIAETRSMGWPLFVATTIKDIIRHKNAVSLKKLIADSSSLKSDFQELERLFKG